MSASLSSAPRRPIAEPSRGARPLYTPAERARRDATRWTLVQGVLAPLQFLVFAVSLVLVLRALLTGEGEGVAAVSVMIKTGLLLAIMLTGAIWEKVVFGRWLFAPAFFWEDVVSMGVIALHLGWVCMYVAGAGGTAAQLGVALAAYAAYLVNAAQFVWKLRMARLGAAASTGAAAPGGPLGDAGTDAGAAPAAVPA